MAGKNSKMGEKRREIFFTRYWPRKIYQKIMVKILRWEKGGKFK